MSQPSRFLTTVPLVFAFTATFFAVSTQSNLAQVSGPPQPPSVTPQTSAAPSLPGQVTQTREPSDRREPTHENEIRELSRATDRPHWVVGLFDAIAWPSAILVLFFALYRRLTLNDIKELLGIAKPVISKIKIAGTEIEFNLDTLRQQGAQTRDSFLDLVARADEQYKIASAQQAIKEQLAIVMREALPEVLRTNGLAPDPPIRATIHVSDIVFEKYLYQLIDYFPDPASGGEPGRRFSQRFGIIGRAWRMKKSMGRGNAVASPENAVEQLIERWGMTYEEAARSRARQNPADLCVILRSEDEGKLPIGLLFVDSRNVNAFGTDPATPQDPSQANTVATQLEATRQVGELARAVARAMVPLRAGTVGIRID